MTAETAVTACRDCLGLTWMASAGLDREYVITMAAEMAETVVTDSD